MSHLITSLLRLKDGGLDVLSSRFVRWMKPLVTSLPLATLTDLGKSKSELLAEKYSFTPTTHCSQTAGETASVHQGRSHPPRPVGQVGSNLAAGSLDRST
jgi:hypothetical protein